VIAVAEREPPLASQRVERIADAWLELLERLEQPIPAELAPRHARMVDAFRRAQKRGLTRPELRDACGEHWRRHLVELVDAGFVFTEHRSQFSSKTWRWVLAEEPDVQGGLGRGSEIPF
jgi:hypothetical protein